LSIRSKWPNLRLLFLSLVLGALLALPAVATAAETGNIRGTVTEEGGEPVVEAEVCAEAVDKSHFKCIPTRTDGSYEITGLAKGEYKVGFWDEPANFVTQFYEGKLTWSEATPVGLEAGETRQINGRLERGATIGGTVTAAATGLPVAEVEACATSTATAEPIERCAKTNAGGAYLIEGVPYLPGTPWNVYFYAQKAKADVVSQPFSGGAFGVGAKQSLTGVNAALGPGGQIAGTVRLASTGAPLGGVLVCATMAGNPHPLACVRTPASGAYRFTRVWPGMFKIAFSAEPKELYGAEGVAEAAVMEREEAAAGYGSDAFPTQWWSGASTFETATPIAITPPQIVNNVDASLLAPPAVVPPASPPATTAPVAKKPVLKCKKGFVKRKVKGKQRCVRRHKAKPKKHKKVAKAPQGTAAGTR